MCSKIPQELIDYIILLSDHSTIISARQFLSEHNYRKSMKLEVNDMIKYSDKDALEYNAELLEDYKETIINRIIVYTEDKKLEEMVEWAYSNGFVHNGFTIRIILIKNCKFTTNFFLNYLITKNFHFHTYYYNLAIYWENYYFVEFLIKNHIKPNMAITETAANKRKPWLIKKLLNLNLINLSQAFKYVAYTQDKPFIKKVSKYLPIHINITVKYLRDNGTQERFIKWLLRHCLFLENNHQLEETMYILSKMRITEEDLI